MRVRHWRDATPPLRRSPAEGPIARSREAIATWGGSGRLARPLLRLSSYRGRASFYVLLRLGCTPRDEPALPRDAAVLGGTRRWSARSRWGPTRSASCATSWRCWSGSAVCPASRSWSRRREHPGRIVMEDAGERSLAELAKPLAGDDLIGLAVALAQAVAGMHRRGVMHRNLTPAHVVVSAGGVPCLVGFGAAASSAEIRPEPPRHAEIGGPGLRGARADRAAPAARSTSAPTSTPSARRCTSWPPAGRRSRPATRCELAHHCWPACRRRRPRSNPAMPALLSEIIMHLLEKEPDHRYQSAEAAIHDLERLRAPGAAGGLRVGERDVPLRLRPPSRLVGRDDGGRGAGGGVRRRAVRPVPRGAGRRRARGRQDGAGRGAADGGDRRRRLVRRRQVRPVPAGPGVRCGASGAAQRWPGC